MLLSHTRGMLCANTKAQVKSWDAFEIERAVATGDSAFGRFDVRQGRVSHVSHELGERAVKERLRRLANGNNQRL